MILNEWKSEGQNGLKMPQDVLARMRFKVVLLRLNESTPIICWCESYEHEPMIESLKLKGIIYLTSRGNSTTMSL